MKKKYFINGRLLAILFFLSSALYSQWISKTGVTTYNITDIKFINSSTGFLCTAYEPWPGTVDGQLIKTTNSGVTWNVVFTDNHKKFMKIFFINENTGFARLLPYVNYTYQNNICRTTNGGVNWDTIYYSSPIINMFFINPNSGWGVGSVYSSGIYTAKILKTTNSGNSWSIITPGEFNLTTVQFPDSITGYASGTINNIYSSTYKDIIMKTVNGGLNWIVKDSSFSFQVTGQCFVNANTGYVSGNNGSIIKTTNGGDSWQALSTGFSSSINSISFASPQRGWGILNSGSIQYIYYTYNSGLNWNAQYSLSTNNSLNVICMSNIYSGWAGGTSGYLLYTNNGGSTFLKLLSTETSDNYSLLQNYPNPFNPSTIIRFKIKENAFVTLKVFDILGKEISTLVNEKLNTGTYETQFSDNQISSGVYLYKLTSDNYIEVRKMALLK
jgi:photosystem II stability/assembly factor-like uncharacterized protein